jgi:hypothetical protein
MTEISGEKPEVSKTFALRPLLFAFSFLCALLFVLCGSAQAQKKDKIVRIGFLDPSTAAASAFRLEQFWQEIRKLGWIEGKNITIEGTKPADLTVQQATKFELIINLKAANQIGLTIPPRVLERANRVMR